MKNNILKLFLLLLIAAITLSFASCGKDGTDDTGDGDDTSDGGNTVTPPAEEDDDPENLVLIKDNKAKFRIVTTYGVGSNVIKSVQAFIENLREIGVEVEDEYTDGDASNVFDCEIIVGTDVKNRDAKYALNARDYGVDGYEIKVVDNKVLIGGGSPEQTKAAFDYFVKSVVKLTGKVKKLSDFKLERSYNRLRETDYIISGVTIAGTELSEYVFVESGLEHVEAEELKNIRAFRENLYSATGYWLETARADAIPEGKKMLAVRVVEDAGSDGFRAYVDSDGNFILESAYWNAIDKAFAHIVDTYILDKIGAVTISKSFEKTLPVSVVYYKQFGAKGDGVTDDFTAIYNAHMFANKSGQLVMGDGPDAKYYIHAFDPSILVETDVDFNGATFHLDDRGSEVYKVRGNALFCYKPSLPVVTYTADQLHAKFGEDIGLEFGTTEIPWLVGEIQTTSFVFIRNHHKDYIRWGGNISDGQNRRDVFVIEPDGKLHEDTPIIWDFVASSQMLNNGRKFEIVSTSAIEYMAIYRADEKPLTMKNGYFERDACAVVAETGYENVYHAYGRGISIQRCNVTIEDLHHKIISEPYLPTSGYGYDADFKLRHSYPYGGFLAFSNCYNSRAINCDLNAHTTYYEAKSSSATPIAMGTYDLTIGNATNIYLEGLTNGVDHCDAQYWGIMCSNGGKNLNFKNCVLSRFDAHEGFWNASLINCEFGRYINVIGGGYLYCENTTRVVDQQFISLRADYGSHFNGTIELVDCTHKGMRTYRGGSTDVNFGVPYPENQEMRIISGGYNTDNYKSVYDPNEASTFPFLKWDFGYVCHMPQHLIIDNFTFEHGDPYVFFSVGDYAFEKPDDFVQKHDYQDRFIGDRPMTDADVYYNKYEITKSIKFRNMEAYPVCSNKNSYLYEHLTPKIVVEYDEPAGE